MSKLDERAIFDAARQVFAPLERRLYLSQACQGDESLLARVEALLRVHEGEPDFLLLPAVPHRAPNGDGAEKPGDRIGPYELVEEIAAGGFGVVFLAEQREPIRRKVALKVIKAGMDTREVVARFEAERRALALMEHAHIARVFDAGATPVGRPYFVMELIQGSPITRYCDDERLDLRQRLILFVQVCGAVQHAHQKGIIHRDLKPNNVLVASCDGAATPKVIDFGVAKALGERLTERTLVTSLGGIIGTLEYMSPEQAEAGAFDIDTRSDVYSLGVLLYELLAGTTPLARQRLKRTSWSESLRLIREEEPPRPSSRLGDSKLSPADACERRKLSRELLTRAVRGELDWIAMKALEKDRDRRYQTANALARDIERYLNDEAVEACPPSAGYRLRKFARKNHKLLAAATSFACLLTVAAAVSGWLAYRATRAESVMARERDRAEQEAARASAHVYVAHMNLAQTAWEENRFGRLATLLEDHRPKAGEADLRGFEWHYWQRLAETPRLAFDRHDGLVNHAVFSPDCALVASASHDLTTKIWHAGSGRELHTLRGHDHIVLNVAFSSDGLRLATASFDATVKLWDVATGTNISTLSGHRGPVVGVAFHPDGRQLASASYDGNVKLWDVESGKELKTISARQDNVTSVVFSPDGLRLASGGKDRTIKLWDVKSGEELAQFTGHADEVACIAFSPDGSRLASAGYDRTLRVWHVARGECLATIDAHSDRVLGVAFSPDGDQLASASLDRTVKLWDAKTFGLAGVLKGHQGAASSAAYSPDGRWLASASRDRTVKIWSIPAGQEAMLEMDQRAAASPALSVAISPDGAQLASAGHDPRIKVWDAASGQSVRIIEGHQARVAAVAYSPQGDRLVSASDDRTVRVWDAHTGRAIHTLAVTAERVLPCLAVSPDGRQLAAAAGGAVVLWDLKNGEQIASLGGNEHAIASLAFSPDGKWLAAGTRGHTVVVWDRTGANVAFTLLGHRAGATATGVEGVAFSPNSRLLASAGGDHCVKVWDVSARRELATLIGHAYWMTGVAFSPDGRRLASASADWTIKLWDLTTLEETLTLKGPAAGAMSLAFDPDGRRLASAWFDGGVRLYDTRPWTRELRLEAEARGWLRRLRSQAPSKSELIRRLEQSDAMPDDAREETLKMARRYQEEPDELAALGNAYAAAGQWQLAAEALRSQLEARPDRSYDWLRAAPIVVLAGDEAAYRDFCQAMIRQFCGASDAFAADRVCKACLLRPGAADLSELPVDRLRYVAGGDLQTGYENWFRACCALASYREGNAQDAITWASQVDASNEQLHALTLVIRAMAEHRLGQTERARQTLAEAAGLIPVELRNLGADAVRGRLPVAKDIVSLDWLIPEILRREASGMIDGP